MFFYRFGFCKANNHCGIHQFTLDDDEKVQLMTYGRSIKNAYLNFICKLSFQTNKRVLGQFFDGFNSEYITSITSTTPITTTPITMTTTTASKADDCRYDIVGTITIFDTGSPYENYARNGYSGFISSHLTHKLLVILAEVIEVRFISI